VQSAIETAVKRRIEASDLQVGCFLSGGIDSGIVTAMAAQYASKLHTFTFSFDGMWDETDAAALVAKQYETVHTSIRLHYDSLSNDIGKILLSYGQPFADDSAIPSYYIAREAKEFVTVVLNGDGGDEIFGGYRRYVPSQWPGLLRNGLKVASSALSILPVPASKMSVYNYAYRLLRMQQADPSKRYLASTTDLLWEKHWGLIAETTEDWLLEIFTMEGLSNLQRQRLLDYKGLLPAVLLPKIDIATMQHSLESRTVFFAPEVISASANIPDHLLVGGTETKRILRRIAAKLLPAKIAEAPKRGFETPLDHIVDVELGEMIRDSLLQPSFAMRSLLSQKTISEIFERKIRMSEDRRARILYALFALEFWSANRPQCTMTEQKQ
jgi:asparagine synthase (glutamine-hydrolysing)